MIGETFGLLTVLAKVPRPVRYRGASRVLCRCACGREKEIVARNLRRGVTRSCGCYQRLNVATRSRKHGDAATRVRVAEYGIYGGMLQRCYSRSCRAWPNYGGRGIKVCERWRASYPAFLQDMGRRPSPHHSIDRIDNDGNYEPGNCRWADQKTQCRNTRTNRRIAFGGLTLTIGEWSERTGLSLAILRYRLSHGWPLERALTVPSKWRLGRPRRKPVPTYPKFSFSDQERARILATEGQAPAGGEA